VTGPLADDEPTIDPLPESQGSSDQALDVTPATWSGRRSAARRSPGWTARHAYDRSRRPQGKFDPECGQAGNARGPETHSDLERTTGLEPATPTLARWCSTN
jgi:hypothetical protein